jgi:signal transduction histidine kinase
MDEQPIKVLLVDDDEDDYVIIRDLLSEIDWTNFDVQWASTYEEALEASKVGAYQVCLIDYRLGERNGLELMHQLRWEGFTAPMILLTGYGDREVDVKAMEDGAADYIEKGQITSSLLERSTRYAIERAKHLASLRRSEKHLRLLSAKLIEAQERERKLIARELHDSIGASLTAIIYGLEDSLEKASGQQAAQLKEVLSMARETVEETRRISTNLRPAIVDDLGILATIRWFTRQFQGLYADIDIVQQLEVQEAAIAEPLKIVIYRILQEALNNVAKHSEAGTVRICLRQTEEKLQLTIEDDGEGFQPEVLVHQGDTEVGMGLESMKERTEISGGFFVIRSARGQGTVVEVSWPLSPEKSIW